MVPSFNVGDLVTGNSGINRGHHSTLRKSGRLLLARPLHKLRGALGGFMRVLLEYKNKRVDIKTPISMQDKVEENPKLLACLIDEALTAVGGRE